MSDMVIPVVTVEDTHVPLWARVAIRDKRWVLFQPECLVAARIHFSYWFYTGLDDWYYVSVLVDGKPIGLLACPHGDGHFAAEATTGRHRFTIEPRASHDTVEPVTLELCRGTVVLIDVYAKHSHWFRWLGGRRASVTFRILPRGFALSGRWGERWGRRFGWSD